ncbi:hypothetical protein K438DRAFT_1991400 [Mycena galopus ATCC 62051]|nr:hypothetical protein K438DRAFT_1991400 [Mycena galopus ATCC 62051]
MSSILCLVATSIYHLDPSSPSVLILRTFIFGNPLGAVQNHCCTHSFCGFTALPKSSTYFFGPSAVTPTPSSLPPVPYSNAPASASSACAVELAPMAIPLPPAPPSAENLFSSEFIQSVANGLDEFVDVRLFRGDGDLNFERDFGQWFNPDDVGVLTGEQTTPTKPNATPPACASTPRLQSQPVPRLRYPSAVRRCWCPHPRRPGSEEEDKDSRVRRRMFFER